MTERYLDFLCNELNNRRTGTADNRAATDFFARTMTSFGFQIEKPEFDCMNWSTTGASLSSSGAAFKVAPSPYSPGVLARAPLVMAASLPELELLARSGAVREMLLLLRGELTKEQLMPKNFPFYNPEEHQHVYRLVESSSPLAVITASSYNPESAGGIYPFPLFEDGDFDIPSVFMTEGEGRLLASQVGEEAILEIRAQRTPATGCNVIASKKGRQHRESQQKRVSIMAHIDSKDGSPGALDNAAGITALLLLGERLIDYSGRLDIEIAAINGEDYYANSGEMRYLQDNSGRFDQITLGINIDGLGYIDGRTAFSLYDCPTEIEHTVRSVFASHPEFVEGDPWVQGDHSLFLINQRPALALTSERLMEIMHIIHTDRDTPAFVDFIKLTLAAQALHELVLAI